MVLERKKLQNKKKKSGSYYNWLKIILNCSVYDTNN